MGQTLTHGVYLPDEGERNCYSGLAANWQILDTSVGTIAEHTTQIAGKAPAVHTHTKADITDFPVYGNTAGTICEGNDSRLSDARTPVSHSHGSISNDGKLANGNKVVITNANKVITESSVTDTELGYLSGVTSAIQTQISGKANASHTHSASDITSGLATVATSGSYNDLTNKPTIPTVNNATLTIQKNGTDVQTFTANQSTNATANITVPTKTSDLTNDSGFITSDNTKIPLAGSNAISGSLIPATTDAYDLGGSSYQWNNAYIKSLTINGTQFLPSGFVKVTDNQTIGGIKTFSNDIRISKTSPFCNVFSSGYIKGQAPTSNIYSGVRFFDDINSGSTNTITGGFEIEYNSDGYNKSYIASRNYAGENHKFFTVGLRVPNDDIRSIDFLPSANAFVNLGTSTNKWKSFNGINPGALSLPDMSSGTGVSLSAGSNSYSPPSSGWLSINLTGAISVVCGNFCHSGTDMLSVPVVKGSTYTVTVATSGTAYLFVSQGNV